MSKSTFITLICPFFSSFSIVFSSVVFHLTSTVLSSAKLYHFPVFFSISLYCPILRLLIVISPSTFVVYVPITFWNSSENKSNFTFPRAILWLSLSTLYIFKFPFLWSFVIFFLIFLFYYTTTTKKEEYKKKISNFYVYINL